MNKIKVTSEGKLRENLQQNFFLRNKSTIIKWNSIGTYKYLWIKEFVQIEIQNIVEGKVHSENWVWRNFLLAAKKV